MCRKGQETFFLVEEQNESDGPFTCSKATSEEIRRNILRFISQSMWGYCFKPTMYAITEVLFESIEEVNSTELADVLPRRLLQAQERE